MIIIKKIIFILILLILLFPKTSFALTDTSQSSIVMDIDTGRILYQKNMNDSKLIASTTKIMTFLISVLYANDLNEQITVGPEVLKAYGTNIYLEMDEKISLIDLLYGLILRSGNDASLVIAKHIGGSIDNFVYLMNEKARELGMINTIFENPHGLDEETKNYSSAYDLAILTRHLYLNFPLYKKISSTKYYDTTSSLKSYSWTNRNKLIFTYDKLTTAKNGYTPSAGKTLVTTATNNDLNLLIVTLSDPNIYETHKNLYEYYFSNYFNHLIISKDDFIKQNSSTLNNCYINNDFKYPITKEEQSKIKTELLIDEQRNKRCGYVKVYLDDSLINETEILSYKKMTKSNIFQKIKQFFLNLFNK